MVRRNNTIKRNEHECFHSKGWFPYDRRRSRIADRRSQKVLRSSAIIWKHTSAIVCDPAIICDRLRSCDHIETQVLRSAIEKYPIIFLILTDDSTLLSHKARMFVYSNAHFLLTWLALNIVARYECVYNHNSCLLYTSPSPRDLSTSRMPSSA